MSYPGEDTADGEETTQLHVRTVAHRERRGAQRMKPRKESSGLWDVKDVARYLKASRSWVYQQAEAGRLPCRRVVGLLRFDPDAVKAFTRGEN